MIYKRTIFKNVCGIARKMVAMAVINLINNFDSLPRWLCLSYVINWAGTKRRINVCNMNVCLFC